MDYLKVCFGSLVQVEKLLGELGLGNVSRLHFGVPGYQAASSWHRIVSTIQGDYLKKVQAMNPRPSALVKTAKPSNIWGKKGDPRLAVDIQIHALQIFKLNWKISQPCPNMKFVKETSRLYKRTWETHRILCLDG